MTGRRAALIAAAIAVTGCGSPATQPPVELAVAAASSLRAAVTGLTEAYVALDPRVIFTVATDSSATLRTQIEQGAPTDVFLSADTRNPGALADEGLTTGEPLVFATNTIALVVPAGNPAGITVPVDLARPGVRIVAAADTVPIAAYAARVVQALAGTAADPAAFSAAVQANVVSREQNVAAVLARIELGEGDAAFVYASDAAAARGVVSIPIPEAANVRAEYAGVVIRASARTVPASEFLTWLAGPAGAAVLEPLGFSAP